MKIAMRHRARQQGAALMVTLALLVVGLLLGLSSYQSARQEEAMAGNQRAGALAMMAAEYGAAQFWHDVQDALLNGDIDSPGLPGPNESYDSYLGKILKSFSDWASDAGYDPTGSTCQPLGGDLENACFLITVDTIGGDLVSITSDGFVHEGPVEVGSGGVPDNRIARRQINMGWGAALGESLSALNFAGDVFDLDGISSQAEVAGEDVDGFINPAISVRSRALAEVIVRDIQGNENAFSDVIFIPNNPEEYKSDGIYGDNIEGVYHHRDAVDFSQDPPVYAGNYNGCSQGASRLCNYKGGVASKLGTPILSDANLFDGFVGSLVTQTDDSVVWGDAEYVKSQSTPVASEDPGKVFFVTNQTQGEYFRPIYDGDNIREAKKNKDSDEVRLERDFFDLGGFEHKGILVVDGDVEFSGNPQFEGLIIVLGDYSVKGGGGDPFVGTVISAPYSVHFQDGNDTVSPDRDGSGDFFIDPEGNEIAPANSKLVMHGATTEDVGKTEDDYPVFIDASGNIIYLTDAEGQAIDRDGSPIGENEERVPASPYFGGVLWDSADLNITRQFDPSGFTVSGGGALDYHFDYDVIEAAFDLMADETLLAWLIGQRRPDGSFGFELSTWRETIVIN